MRGHPRRKPTDDIFIPVDLFGQPPPKMVLTISPLNGLAVAVDHDPRAVFILVKVKLRHDSLLLCGVWQGRELRTVQTSELGARRPVRTDDDVPLRMAKHDTNIIRGLELALGCDDATILIDVDE